MGALTRSAGEGVGIYNVTGVTFDALPGAGAANYVAPTSFTGIPTLTINPATLTATIANQTKVYGVSDSALAGIGVTLSGLVSRSVTSWNGSTSVNDSAAVNTTLASLARVVGENAGSYAITGASFNALTGTGAANYSAPTFAGSPTLTITTVPLTATIASQAKVYGQDDPALLGITPTLNGVVNGVSVTNWMGASTTLNDSVNAALANLARQAGENVGSYAITGASFGALSGTGASNYSAPTFSGSPVLTITPASVAVTSVTKTYDGTTAVTSR